MNYLRVLQLRRLAADGAGGAGGSGGAGDGAAGDGDAGEKKPGGDGGGEDKPKTFTQEDIDRVVGDRLKRERAKWEKETETKIQEAQTEAEKMAKMTADQRAEVERTKREKALADREKEITRRELRAQALESLAEKGLPKELADTLVYTDADSCTASIEAVDKSFRAAVEAAVNDRLRGDPPKAGGGAQPDHDKMTDAEYYSATMKKKE